MMTPMMSPMDKEIVIATLDGAVRIAKIQMDLGTAFEQGIVTKRMIDAVAILTESLPVEPDQPVPPPPPPPPPP